MIASSMENLQVSYVYNLTMDYTQKGNIPKAAML
jgi:uncharacterized protein YgbK (DUF1537 family)